jgi:hypothetical protein
MSNIISSSRTILKDCFGAHQANPAAIVCDKRLRKNKQNSHAPMIANDVQAAHENTVDLLSFLAGSPS